MNISLGNKILESYNTLKMSASILECKWLDYEYTEKVLQIDTLLKRLGSRTFFNETSQVLERFSVHM